MENSIIVADADQSAQATFYKKTYGHLALGVLLFVVIEALFLQITPLVEFLLSLTQGYLWLALLGGFMGITYVAQKMVADKVSKTKQYSGFLLYIIAQALIFVPILYIAIVYTEDGSLLTQAAMITGGLFLGLSMIVFGTSADFSFLKSILTIGFFIALATIVGGMIFGFELGLWFSVAMIVLASASILYETYKIKNNYYLDEYVPAALSLFASLMLLFWYVLRLLMSRD